MESAGDLLRLALRYGPGGQSLRSTAAWAEISGVASISDVALLNRLRKASHWLCAIVDGLLPKPTIEPAGGPSRCIRLLDASSVSRPRSTGTDWRLHASYDLRRSRFSHFELTGPEGGEVFQRFPIAANDIVIGDRGYARHTGLRAVCHAGADFLVRAGWRTQRPRDADQAPVNLSEIYRQAAAEGLLEGRVVIEELSSQGPGIGARMIVLPKSEAQSDRSRLRVVRKNRKKGRKTHPMSLLAADYLVLLTTLDAKDYPADRVIALYRMRWQIELAFKRPKSLIGIDKLPARDPDLARAWLAAHLIVALLTDAGTGKVLDSPPCASGQLQQPVALARTQGAPRLDHDGHRWCHLR